MNPIAPGSTIGIFGGGQLGRMTALAAARLGYRCHIFCPEADSPAAEVSAAATIADYTDIAALDTFAASIEVATFEFENVPYEAVARVAAQVPVRPGWEALRTSQDRAVEKRFLGGIGLETAPWIEVRSAADLRRAPCPGPAAADGRGAGRRCRSCADTRRARARRTGSRPRSRR